MRTNTSLTGIRALLASKKGVMSLLILLFTTGLAAFSKLNADYAAVIGIIQTIYCYTAYKTDTLLSARKQEGPGHNE